MSTILLVEDHPDNRDLLARRLKRQGYTVRTAEDGQLAIDAVAESPPDLILMDLDLPVIDGWEATRRIKASPQSATVPIVALTAHVMPGDRERAVEAGCDDYDTKPVDFKRLVGKIERLLAERGRTGELIGPDTSQ